MNEYLGQEFWKNPTVATDAVLHMATMLYQEQSEIEMERSDGAFAGPLLSSMIEDFETAVEDDDEAQYAPVGTSIALFKGIEAGRTETVDRYDDGELRFAILSYIGTGSFGEALKADRLLLFADQGQPHTPTLTATRLKNTLVNNGLARSIDAEPPLSDAMANLYEQLHTRLDERRQARASALLINSMEQFSDTGETTLRVVRSEPGDRDQ